MPEIEIRPAIASDIPKLIELDHGFTTDHVWQMELTHEQSQIGVNFRKVRLPRSVRVDYPRPARALAENWQRLAGLLVAEWQEKQIGYSGLIVDRITQAVWVTDLAWELVMD